MQLHMRTRTEARRAGWVVGVAIVAMALAGCASPVTAEPDADATPMPMESVTAACPEPTVSHVWHSPARMTTVPQGPEVEELPWRVESPAPTVSASPQATSAGDGLVALRTVFDPVSAQPGLLRMVDVRSGEELWSADLPDTQEGRGLIVRSPLETGLDEIILEYTSESGTTLVALSAEDGQELSRVTFDGFAWLAQPIRSALWTDVVAGTLVAPQDDLIVVTDSAVISVRPQSLAVPEWEIPVTGAFVTTFGDVVFLDGAAHTRGDGRALDWGDESVREGAGRLLQLGDLLFDVGDGTTLTQVDPTTGALCGETTPMTWAGSDEHGYVVVDTDSVAHFFGASGASLGDAGKVTGRPAGTIAGRYVTFLDDGGYALSSPDAPPVTVTPPSEAGLLGYSEDVLLFQSWTGGEIVAIDAASGAEEWRTQGWPRAENWGGTLVIGQTHGDPFYNYFLALR